MRHSTFKLLALTLMLVAVTIALGNQARANVLVVATTIQGAVDAAQPGDIVRVPAGIYHENVLVTKNNLTIEGSPGAILDGTALPGPSGITVKPLLPSVRINGFRLTGMQIQNYSRNGVFLIRVDNFQIDHGKYVNNDEYGIFPVSCAHGLIEFNQVSGSDDTGIYIGQSQDALITWNAVSDCTVGVNVELSSNITIQDNQAWGNTIGMTTEVLPRLTAIADTNIQIMGNVFSGNNRPNPVTDPAEFVSQLPSGVGLLIAGADNVTVEHNLVLQNDSVGIAAVQLPPALAALDPRINPFPDHDKILENVVLLNGSNPDPKIAPFPPSDLIWDFSGTGNCWHGNIHRTSFPVILPDCAAQ